MSRTPMHVLSWSVVALVAMGCSPASVAPPDAGRDAIAGSDGGMTPTADGGDAGDAGSSPEQSCRNHAYARCAAVQTCSETSLLLAFGDIKTCESYFTQSCLATLAAPSTGATTGGWDACTTALSSWICSDLIRGENTPPQCQFTGTLPAGATCAVSQQCQSGWCAFPYGGACGTCGPLPPSGTPCQASYQCSIGSTCNGGKCTSYGLVGTACSASQPCNDGLTCAGGVCATGATTPGGGCSFTGAGCDEYSGLACNVTSGTCQTLQVVPPGEACGIVANQLQACIAASCKHGTCVAEAPLGGACDAVAGPQCTSFAHCIFTSDGGTSGTCQIAGTSACP